MKDKSEGHRSASSMALVLSPCDAAYLASAIRHDCSTRSAGQGSDTECGRTEACLGARLFSFSDGLANCGLGAMSPRQRASARFPFGLRTDECALILKALRDLAKQDSSAESWYQSWGSLRADAALAVNSLLDMSEGALSCSVSVHATAAYCYPSRCALLSGHQLTYVGRALDLHDGPPFTHIQKRVWLDVEEVLVEILSLRLRAISSWAEKCRAWRIQLSPNDYEAPVVFAFAESEFLLTEEWLRLIVQEFTDGQQELEVLTGMRLDDLEDLLGSIHGAELFITPMARQ